MVVFVTYKTTNIITGNYYFGSHKTENIEEDDYLGSGKKLIELIEKYGKDKFKREILGEFTTRQEAFDLETKLVAEHSGDKLCMNMNDGGGAVFYTDRLREESLQQYAENPRHCVYCGELIPYEKRENDFCDSSCAAKYNNKGRVILAEKGSRYGSRLFKCLWCGKEELIPRSDPKKYCDNHCQQQYQLEHGIVPQKDSKGMLLEENKEDILRRLSEGETQSSIARSFGVTKQRIYEYLKRWRLQQDAK